MSNYSLKQYFAERMDCVQIIELQLDDGYVDYLIRVDGGYSKPAAEGMFDYHKDYLKKVLRAEGLL
jgi:hypothetical protein